MNNQLLHHLRKIIAIPSISGDELAVSGYITDFLRQIGADVQVVESAKNRHNILATIGKIKKSQKYVCLYGHIDTVPPDPHWNQDPFEVQITSAKNRGGIAGGEIATGLGVADMKGAVTCILETARWASTQAVVLKLAFCVDEEQDSLGSHTVTSTKAGLNFFKDVSLLISGESGQIVNENQDFAVNYGRKGRIVIEIIVEGKTAHAARSDEAVNAITQVAKVIQVLETLSFPTHEKLGSVELIPFHLESSTSSFSIPNLATLHINVLTVPGISSTQVIDEIKRALKINALTVKIHLKHREIPYMESYQVDTDHQIIKKLEKDVFSKYSVSPGYAQSVADENRFAHALGIPVISIGPIGGGDHTAREWVSVSSLSKTVEVYKDIAMNLQSHA